MSKRYHKRNNHKKPQQNRMSKEEAMRLDYGKVTKRNSLQLARKIVPKATSRLRADINIWKSALSQIENPEYQKSFAFHNLLKEIKTDARLTSTTENRKLKTTGAGFVIKKANGEIHEELTENLPKSALFNEIMGHTWDVITDGYTLIELDREEDKYICELIPRQNVLSLTKTMLKDYTDDSGIAYSEVPEYGTWLLDFGKKDDIGLINKAIPHVLYKRFAQSCWSELCEIFGIPPRVMKTNTADPNALSRAEQMMKDMGAAAWFIIDDTEQIEWANSTDSNGEVYENLINLCNNEISLLMNGALIGQDSKYGSRGKEQSSQDVLEDVVNADKRKIEIYFKDKVMPALYLIGFLPEDGLSFEFDKAEDLDTLWNRTKEVLPYKKVSDEWIKNKFGIEVEGDRAQEQQNNLSYQGFFD